MMRALGFSKSHLMVYIVLQALSFSIPGLLLGLTIALVLNEAFLEMAMLFMVPGFYSESGLQP